MAEAPLVVVDTSVLVNVFTGGATDSAEWLQHSTWVLDQGIRGTHRVVVPAIVIAEVAGNGNVRGSHIERNERRRRIARVRQWLDASGFMVAELDETSARAAAELAIEHQLTGGDAAVLAAAVLGRCPTLYTWDDGLLKVGASADGVEVRQPFRIEPAQHELQFDRTTEND